MQSLPENPPWIKSGRPIFGQCDASYSESAKRYTEFKGHVKAIQERRKFSDNYLAE